MKKPAHSDTLRHYAELPAEFEFTVMTNEGLACACNERVMYHSGLLRRSIADDQEEKRVVYLHSVDAFSYRLIFTWCHDHLWEYFDETSMLTFGWHEGWFIALNDIKLANLLEAARYLEIHGLIHVIEDLQRERRAKVLPCRVFNLFNG